MSKHGWNGSGHGGKHGSGGHSGGGGDDGRGVLQEAFSGRAALSRSKPVLWTAAIGGLVVWSLLAGAGYAFADAVLDWLAGNAGVAKEATSLVDSQKVGGAMEQTIAALRVVLKPAIIVIWAIGALVLIAAPFVVPRIVSLLGARRH